MTRPTRRGKSVERTVPIDEEPQNRLPDLSEFRASLRVKGRALSETVVAQRRSARY